MNLRKLVRDGYVDNDAMEIGCISWKKLKKWIEKSETKSQEMLDKNKKGTILDGLYVRLYSDKSCSIYADIWPPTSGDKDVLVLSVEKIIF